MPTVNRLDVQLENNPRRILSGETIIGQVELVLNKIAEGCCVTVRLQGKGKVKWTETTGSGENRRTYTYSKKEDITNIVVTLTSCTVERQELSPGRHVFPFSIEVPQNVPSSYKDSYAKIRYKIITEVSRSTWKSNEKAKVDLTVVERIDPNLPQYLMPQTVGTEGEIGCCCWNPGVASVAAQIDRSAYSPGESIAVPVQCDNRSTTETEGIVVALFKLTEYTAHSKTVKQKKKVVSVNGPSLPAQQFKDWRDGVLLVPHGSMPTIANSRVLRVTYYVQVCLVATCSRLKGKLPIVVGTVPFVSSPAVVELPTAPSMLPEPVQPWTAMPSVPGAAHRMPAAPELSSKDAPPDFEICMDSVPPPSYAEAMQRE